MVHAASVSTFVEPTMVHVPPSFSIGAAPPDSSKRARVAATQAFADATRTPPAAQEISRACPPAGQYGTPTQQSKVPSYGAAIYDADRPASRAERREAIMKFLQASRP